MMDGFVSFYSNPEEYAKAKYDEFIDKEVSREWKDSTVTRDDFFPYSDCDRCFRTGYFTSRLKKIACEV